MNRLKKFFSRKLIATLIAPVATAYLAKNGITDPLVQSSILGLFGLYVAGQSYVDSKQPIEPREALAEAVTSAVLNKLANRK